MSEAILDLVDDCIGRGHRLDLLADALGCPAERRIIEELPGRVAHLVHGELVRLDRYAGTAARTGGRVEELVCGLGKKELWQPSCDRWLGINGARLPFD